MLELTSKELAKRYGYSQSQINWLGSKFNIPKRKNPEYKRGRCGLLYDVDAYDKAMAEYKATLKERDLKKSERLKALADKEAAQTADGNAHPLVTDKSFLKLGFFPDVIPNNFEDIEKAVI